MLRSANSAGSYNLLATGVTATNYVDNAVASGVTYYYLVQAVNSCGQSANPPALGITPLPVPQLSADLNGNQLLLSWPSWAGSYTVYTTTNLTLPSSWQPVTNVFQNSYGTLSLTLPMTNSAQQFFRLVSQ